MNRRDFILASTAGITLTASKALADPFVQITGQPVKNKLPRWRGFNILDFFQPVRFNSSALNRTEEDFKWMEDWGFNFVRIPMAYPGYINYDPQSGADITPEQTVDFNEEAIAVVERTVYVANKYGLHVSLSLHRAPGFCINAGFNEPFNLWDDQEAQQAFYEHWAMWSKRFRNIPSKMLSFDLVNEPCYKKDMNDQFASSEPITGEIYRKVTKGCLSVIHNQTADRIVVADGNHGGALVIPELTNLPVGQSCRGYFPHYVSHYRADWVWINPDDAPLPQWPGIMNGEAFSRKTLEDFYQPWIDLVRQGVGVHCGECGCYNETPHEVFLAWFNDQLDVLTSHGIGWGLWNFRGDFGLINSGRKDVDYEVFHGQKLDRKLLNLLQKY